VAEKREENLSTKEQVRLAQSMAIQAMTVVQSYGFMFESLLGTMRDNNLISASQIKTVFFGAAAAIDATEPIDDLQKQAKRAMRDVVTRVAKGAGVEIPPPGQTGIQRKH
jgi:hypothetical protein